MKLSGVVVCAFLSLFSRSIPADTSQYSPPIVNPFPDRLYWGDLHVHSNMSSDAFGTGNRTVSPSVAYRFARGETVVSASGIEARLSRPLDFLLVSDHAEFLGVYPRVFERSKDIVDTPLGTRWVGYLESGMEKRVLMEMAILGSRDLNGRDLDTVNTLDPTLPSDFIEQISGMGVPSKLQQSIWNQVGWLADNYNEPGRFTAFIGYEWTSMPNGNNLHRNVLFRDSANQTSKVLPFSALDSRDPEDLWRYMADYEERTGGRVLAIPHNGNLSNGLMFSNTTLSGKAITKDYASRRARWEPVIEVTQIKGDGETHPLLSPNDEFSDFETWDHSNVLRSIPKKNSMLKFEYARSALRIGLGFEHSLGNNPFAFGLIGSTDSHTGLATADEDNFFGKLTFGEPSVNRASLDFSPGSGSRMRMWKSVASGYTAIWARENSRQALFDALVRREVYATTGPRTTVRFFGGWSFADDDHLRPDLASVGYRMGVPMGGYLIAKAKNGSPRFLIAALKDPLGANLDRIQIIKGWMDNSGSTHEVIYNVAASDDHELSGKKIQPVGSSVDVLEASYRNSVGDVALSTVWEDPDFDPEQPAFYYVRVLQIPTPRWPTIDAKVLGSELPEGSPESIQERAYTSPIWYKPSH